MARSRRMFSSDIVTSDKFLDMPGDSQLLYFHLGIQADDDGFVAPKKVTRMIGAQDDSLKLLIGKGFLIPFKSGVIVIRHWREHNSIRVDRYQPTSYADEKRMLTLDGRTYNVSHDGNQLATIGRASKEVSKKGSKEAYFNKTGNQDQEGSLKSIREFVESLPISKRKI